MDAKMRDNGHGLTDIKAERATVGAMLVNPESVLQVQDWLAPSDFHSEAARCVYQGLRDLIAKQQIPDYVTVMAWLDQHGHLNEIGGAPYLTQLAQQTPNVFSVVEYAKIVQRLGTLRRLVDAATEMVKLAHSDNADVEEVFARARSLVDNAAPVVSDNDVLLWLDSLGAFIDFQIERKAEQTAIENGESVPRATFPWRAFQRYIKWLRGGMVGIVAAKSSVGKTAFMECCAEAWAQAGLNVVFFHFELSHKLMLDRRACRWSGMTMDEIEAGMVDRRIDAANAALRNWPGGIHYVHCPGWTAGRVAAKIRQLYAKGLCDIAIIDYLQKARLVYQNGQNKAQATGDAVEVWKNTAEDLDLFILTGSQFTKAANQASRKTAEDIRDSGEPEEKANIVITLDRPILDDEMRGSTGQVIATSGERSPITTARVDKNTTGQTGDAQLYFNGARFAFYDMEAQ